MFIFFNFVKIPNFCWCNERAFETGYESLNAEKSAISTFNKLCSFITIENWYNFETKQERNFNSNTIKSCLKNFAIEHKEWDCFLLSSQLSFFLPHFHTIAQNISFHLCFIHHVKAI
jgi:hypothetical protein